MMPQYAPEPRLSQVVAVPREGGELHLDVLAEIAPFGETENRALGEHGMIEFRVKMMGKSTSSALSSSLTPSPTCRPCAARPWCRRSPRAARTRPTTAAR